MKTYQRPFIDITYLESDMVRTSSFAGERAGDNDLNWNDGIVNNGDLE